MESEPSVAERVSFIVRIVLHGRGEPTGIVERVGTAEKHRFEGIAEMGRIIERSVAEHGPGDPAR